MHIKIKTKANLKELKGKIHKITIVNENSNNLIKPIKGLDGKQPLEIAVNTTRIHAIGLNEPQGKGTHFTETHETRTEIVHLSISSYKISLGNSKRLSIGVFCQTSWTAN